MQDSDTDGQRNEQPRERPQGPPDERSARLVSFVAVAAVAAVALGAAWYVPRHGATVQATAATAPAMQLPTHPLPPQAVVQAPPLAPPATAPVRGAATAQGAGAACADCGTVVRVAALRERGRATAKSFQMQVRMDAGGEQVIEQRGAMAPGSRVRLRDGQLVALTPAG